MRERKYRRELKRISRMSLAELRARAARNKRLLVNALAARFRTAYGLRKRLSRAYGREIARRLSEK